MKVTESSIAQFLEGKRFGLIGASSSPDGFSRTVSAALRDHGYEVVPVNPHRATIDDATCYPAVGEVPGRLDGAILMVPADVALLAVRDCLAAGIANIWLFQGIGQGATSEAAVAVCAAAGANVVAGACPLMFLEPVSGVHRLHRRVRKLRGALIATPAPAGTP